MKNIRSKTNLAWLVPLSLVSVAGLSACSTSAKKASASFQVARPVETLYSRATTALDRHLYDEAATAFEEVERQHPFSEWARRSLLMSAYAYYEANKYDEAIAAADRFIGLHPGNKDAPYAYYLIAQSWFEQILDVGRDQATSSNALQALNEIVRRFPDSDYALDARVKIDMVRDQLAGKDMEVGRYYLKHRRPIAAINRFSNVLKQYQTTTHAPEALHRMVEANLSLGLVDEARRAGAVLGYNFPGSRWYADSYKLLRQAGALSEEQSLPEPVKQDAVATPATAPPPSEPPAPSP